MCIHTPGGRALIDFSLPPLISNLLSHLTPHSNPPPLPTSCFPASVALHHSAGKQTSTSRKRDGEGRDAYLQPGRSDVVPCRSEGGEREEEEEAAAAGEAAPRLFTVLLHTDVPRLSAGVEDNRGCKEEEEEEEEHARYPRQNNNPAPRGNQYPGQNYTETVT